ncbi:MAG TPA: cytochrome C [Bacillales bacterium]|nr:cytochrome C [Bacillales bacterium]
MNKAIISFVISALIGLGLGYVVYKVLPEKSGYDPQQIAATNETGSDTTSKDASSKDKGASTSVSATAANEDNILSKKGCLGCHSVGSLNLQGGQVGPDLSQAFTTVEGKHGKPIEEFLKQPTSAVMSGVIGKDPLTDDQRKQVLDLLKKASEAQQ